MGNMMLASKLRDLTVLTTLFTMRRQNDRDAEQSYLEHLSVIDALAAGDADAAADRMDAHLGTWELKIHKPEDTCPLATLRTALEPIDSPLTQTRPLPDRLEG
jgi:DNA-binding GntR family transcriptional regulator